MKLRTLSTLPSDRNSHGNTKYRKRYITQLYLVLVHKYPVLNMNNGLIPTLLLLRIIFVCIELQEDFITFITECVCVIILNIIFTY